MAGNQDPSQSQWADQGYDDPTYRNSPIPSTSQGIQGYGNADSAAAGSSIQGFAVDGTNRDDIYAAPALAEAEAREIQSYSGQQVLGDGTQFQQLSQSAFQQVYQVAQSSYDRSTPVDDFAQPGPSSALDQQPLQHHIHSMQAGQIITVPVQILDNQGVSVSSSSLNTTNASSFVSVVTNSFDQQQHQIPMDRGDSVSQPGAVFEMQSLFSQAGDATSSGDAGAPLVISAAAGDQLDSSEATPLVISADAGEGSRPVTLTINLEHAKAEYDMMNEPDTTQEEDSTAFTIHHAQAYESNEAFAAPSHIRTGGSDSPQIDSSALSQHQPISAQVLDNGLDSTVSIEEVRLFKQPPGEAQFSQSTSQQSLSQLSSSQLQQMGLPPLEVIPMPRHLEQAHEQMDQTPDTSNLAEEQADLAVRKSARIAEMERSPSPKSRPEYKPRDYNVKEIWCDECQDAFSQECPLHKLQPIFDKVVLTRAWASLPPMLQIFRVGDTPQKSVHAKRLISKRTQFGPFQADPVESLDKLSDEAKQFPLQVFKEKCNVFLDTKDENKCNWMIFVRPAENYKEQNMVAYQHGQDIYFTVTKDIEAKQELKVWYAAHYAHRMGIKTHTMSEMDQKALEEASMKFACYECDKRFKTSVQLQLHVATHENDDYQEEDDDVEDPTITDSNVGKAKRRLPPSRFPLTKKRRFKGNKKIKDIMANSEESSKFQSWKKRKTNMYLNKINKYKKPVKQAVKALYKRRGLEGNEWVCTTCELTFDNPSLLNLHTLTHAAENVALQGIPGVPAVQTMVENGQIYAQTGETIKEELAMIPFKCPVCNQQFENKQDLIQHASEHGKTRRTRSFDSPGRPYKCKHCWKSFAQEERMEKHMLIHGSDDSKPFECNICHKRVMNNSALACHMKVHSSEKYYKCPLCKEGFDQIHQLKSHTQSHAVNGVWDCPECHKHFTEFALIRKHMRSVHSPCNWVCEVCNKEFSRPDKLKLHMLRHTNIREFMCDSCGKQFKRKDKLKEHVKRIHNGVTNGAASNNSQQQQSTISMNSETGAIIITQGTAVSPSPSGSGKSRKFVPKVLPTDYHRFIYKCHTCMLGFKRRGMLINHLAKRHPDQKPESVPELNLPILRTQRDFFCQYCDKVYKSSSKRKAHILKNHPGAELPPGARKKGEDSDGETTATNNLMNATFSTPTGSVTTVPHPCEFCHKQYASRAKLLQHQRKKHPDQVPPVQKKPPAPRDDTEAKTKLLTAHILQPDKVIIPADHLEQVVTVHTNQSDQLQNADLLTQAMSELTQTLNEYRNQPTPTASEYQITQLAPMPANQPVSSPSQGTVLASAGSSSPRSAATNATIIQQIPAGTTIDLNQLGQTLAQLQAVSPQAGSASQIQNATIQGQNITIVSGNTSQAQTLMPISLGGQTAYIPRTWASQSNVSTVKYTN